MKEGIVIELLNFLNNHPSNWREILAAKPYSLEIKEKDNFVLFKYRMLESDFSRAEVLQARGSIFYHDPITGVFEPQSIAMHKFFNATEQYAETAHVDWSTARVLAKVDGSLMKISWDRHNAHWLLSSNGTIFAKDAMTAFGISYEDAFIETIGGQTAYNLFTSQLNKNYTYFFELVSRYNKICVSYDEDAIYYLGCRNMITLKEEYPSPWFSKELNIKYPREYQLSSYEDCQRAVEELGDNQEGFIVCDSEFRRIKMKTPWYIAMHRLRGNGPVTTAHIISLWQNDAFDDFIAAFPEYIQFANDVAKKIVDLCEKAEIAYDCVRGFGSRKDYALRAQSYVKPIQSYLFARLDNKVDSAFDFFKQMKARNLADLIEVGDISHG